jgi:parvulin-like peptidyl-prolyl isomerase
MVVLWAACDSRVDNGDAVAIVGKHKITISSLEENMNRLSQLPGRNFNDMNERTELLKELIQQELLFQYAIKNRIIERSDRLKREIAREMLVEKVGKARYEPTDDEVGKYFESKKNELERVRVSHILIRPDKPGDATSENKAKQKAESILTQLTKGGSGQELFSRLAKEFSQDEANKGVGGDLGFFERGKMVSEFSNAAFALTHVGDVSPVVKTEFGYHIIQLTGEQRGLGFFRQNIQSQLAQEKQKKLADEFFNQLKSDTPIQIVEENIAKASSKPPLTEGAK